MAYNSSISFFRKRPWLDLIRLTVCWIKSLFRQGSKCWCILRHDEESRQKDLPASWQLRCKSSIDIYHVPRRIVRPAGDCHWMPLTVRHICGSVKGSQCVWGRKAIWVQVWGSVLVIDILYNGSDQAIGWMLIGRKVNVQRIRCKGWLRIVQAIDALAVQVLEIWSSQFWHIRLEPHAYTERTSICCNRWLALTIVTSLNVRDLEMDQLLLTNGMRH